MRRSASGVTVDLRVRPGARRSALEPAESALKVQVTAPPQDGKANAQVIALLAEAWRLPRSSFDVVKGQTSRAKTVRVSGEPAVIVAKVSAWLKQR